MALGWIRLDRRILDNWLWQEKPFCRKAAWIDLLLMVNHEPKKVPFDGGVIEVQKGQKITSIRKLAERWGWSVGKVGRFLTVLETERMLTKKRYGSGTVLTIVNYGVYQPSRTENGTPAEHEQNTDGTRTETNKKYNNITNKQIDDDAARTRASTSLIKLYEDNMGAVTPMTAEILADLQSRHADDVIALAIAESVKSNAHSIRYVEKVLQNWESKNVKCAADAQREIQRHADAVKNKDVPSPKKTKFQNYPQEYELSDLERAMMKKRLEDNT